MSSPLVVNFGGGVDSTAILIGMQRRGERPDLVLFADTGGEWPETYAHIGRFSAWLQDHSMPAVTTVSYPEQVRMRPGTTYRTLEGNCLANETLPSEAFGRGACSQKWKQDPMDRFLSRWPPAVAAKARGEKVTRCIGYDADEACGSTKRSRWAKLKEDARYRFRYPLVEWGWTREDCLRVCAETLDWEVKKSACWFCPNTTVDELLRLVRDHPELARRAVRMEDVARAGKHGLRSISGLWRRDRKRDGRPGSWRVFLERKRFLSEGDA